MRTGVVPACRTLDCVSVFAETALDASLVLSAARGHDALDVYSRTPSIGAESAPWVAASKFRFGVPPASSLEFFGDAQNAELYQKAVEALVALGGTPVEFDLSPFLDVAQLLYKGPWVAERYAAIADFIEHHAADMDPTVEKIISGAKNYSAVDAFYAAYKLEALRSKTRTVWEPIDVMMLPTAPRTYTIEEIGESPIARNSHLGHYTNFVNLLDLSALAVPAGFRTDGLPFGVSLISDAFKDAALLGLGDKLHRSLGTALGGSDRKLSAAAPMVRLMPPPGCLLMAVVGAHLAGQPLNWQLTQRKGQLVRTCRTHPDYKFYALQGTVPAKPGLVRVPGYEGPGIEVEVWALPEQTIGSFVEGVPAPLAIGTLRLEDGSTVKGFLVEPAAVGEATEITHFGGWRNYIASTK